ncbi:MAG: tripartite tricarboxylate transporter permease [Defluviitaleaceae bacterium]|nr:tripartite tricarboxylate transporter permease [Defluviitaleaceae bacterium]
MVLLLGYLIDAVQVAFMPVHLLTLVLSVFFGLAVGIIPGLTATMSVALLTGLTFGFPREIAVISLIGVYVGALSGGGQAGILLNIPGTPSSAATVLDGYPMNKQGKAGLAIFLATAASALGTIISVFFVLFLTPPLSRLGLEFLSFEFFLLALFGIVICGNLSSGGTAVKGWIAGFFGLAISTVGLDTIVAYPRFSFGNTNLMAGLQLIPLMIAIFGIPEILKVFVKTNEQRLEEIKFKIKDGISVLRKNIKVIGRGGLIGTFIGIIPGVGEDIGGWLSYWSTKSSSKTPENFGKGEPAGVIAVESGSNACIGGALIPLLSLGVPGSTSAAVMLAAFIMHGYRPGPLLMSDTPELLYQVAIFLLLASISMFLIARLITRFSVKILVVKKEILMPIVFVFCILGAFLVRGSFFDAQLVLIAGFVGFLLSYAKFPPAPLLLGLVLGRMAESNMLRGLLLSGGSFMPIFQRPIATFFFIVILFLIVTQIPFVKNWFSNLRKKKNKEA